MNELNAALGLTGLTVTAQLYAGGAAIGSPVSVSEIGSSGVYSASMPAVAAATYVVVFSAGGDHVAVGSIVWNGTSECDLIAVESKVTAAEAILRNKTVTNPANGIMTVYADDGVTPLLSAQLHEDVAETQIYRGQGANVRGKLE